MANLISIATLNQIGAASGKLQIESRIRGGGISAIVADLDISAVAIHGEQLSHPQPCCTLRVRRDDDQEILLVIMEWTCPAWFEPTTRRLSLNDPRWLDLRTHNYFDDFEPWTKAAIDALCEARVRQWE